jgi:cysteine desulfurase
MCPCWQTLAVPDFREMDPRSRYFDNAATTPLDPRVLQEMLPYLGEEFGNPHSIHGFGQRARNAVERARERVSALLGADDPAQITFTSGATESNNWVLSGFSDGWVSPFEHSSVREPAAARGYENLANDGYALLPPPRPADFVSVHTVNNEMGALFELAPLRSHSVVLHSDITQQLGKLPVDLEPLDYASMSAHKLYGPKGVGALYSAEMPPPPLLLGGGQESGGRAGTLNVAAIVGFGAACAIAEQEMAQDFAHAEELREIVLEGLRPLTGWQVLGGPRVSPFILSLAFEGVQGETLVVEADRAGYAISAGSACSAGSTDLSPALLCLGLMEQVVRGAVRVSFGRFGTREGARDLSKNLLHTVQILRRMG